MPRWSSRGRRSSSAVMAPRCCGRCCRYCALIGEQSGELLLCAAPFLLRPVALPPQILDLVERVVQSDAQLGHFRRVAHGVRFAICRADHRFAQRWV